MSERRPTAAARCPYFLTLNFESVEVFWPESGVCRTLTLKFRLLPLRSRRLEWLLTRIAPLRSFTTTFAAPAAGSPVTCRVCEFTYLNDALARFADAVPLTPLPSLLLTS